MVNKSATSPNKRVSAFGYRLRSNAFADFIYMQSFSNSMSEGTSDTRRTLSELPTVAFTKIKGGINYAVQET